MALGFIVFVALIGLAFYAGMNDKTAYGELAERLKEHGFSETKASIANKLAGKCFRAFLFSGSCGNPQ